MSAGDFGLQLIASEALRGLDAYERSIRAVVAQWLDLDEYATASRELDFLRASIAGVPGLAAAWVTVLISHTELVHALWRCENARAGPNEQQILEDHLAAVRYLRARCERLAAPAGVH